MDPFFFRLRFSRTAVVMVALALVPLTASAAPDLPEPLRPWSGWALRDHREALCPALTGTDERRCKWPGPIELFIDEDGGRFVQGWRVETDAWVPLPGDARMIPLDLRADGRIAPVVIRDGRPGVHLEAGNHRLTGRFAWADIPESLLVPQETAIVTVSVAGRPIESPERDPDGRLWLARRSAEEIGESRLEVTVYRKVDDDVPMRLITWIELRVSGESREEVIGKPLPKGFSPFSLDGPLPARIDSEGLLHARVRPGTHVLELEAMAPSPITGVSLSSPAGAWPLEEVWVLRSRPALRLIELEGVFPIDPAQTRLPKEWRRLPAYRMAKGDEMRFVERHRGAAESRDRVRLNRDLRLDFDGGGFMVRDQLTGNLNEGWRLEMKDDIALGRVTVDGRDRLITEREGSGPGVELRNRSLNLTAEGRLDRNGRIPIVGWDRDMNEASVNLHLPPGWTILDAWGVDSAPGTWLRSWSLLDIFLVLILTIAAARLFGWPMGLLAFFTLTLTFPESGAPRWLWAAVIAFEALRRALPTGGLRTTFKVAYGGTLILLVLATVPFITAQVRQGLDPILERPHYDIEGRYHGGFRFSIWELGAGTRHLFGASADSLAGMSPEEMMSAEYPGRSRLTDMEMDGRRLEEKLSMKADPRFNVQTGFGMPGWSWRSTRLHWAGPVQRDQSFKLILVPPAANRALSFLRAVLTLAFFLCVAGFLNRRKPSAPKTEEDGPPSTGAAGAAVLLLGIAFWPGPAAAGPIPSEQVLEQLRGYLTRPAACHPSCASLPEIQLEASRERLSVEMGFDVAAPTVVPLAGSSRRLVPDSIRIDGEPADSLFRDEEGRVWLRLDEGRHRVEVGAPLPRAASVRVSLPMAPGRIEATARGWSIVGVTPDGHARGSIELVRLSADDEEESPEEVDSLPAFIRVERRLELGLTWEVVTRVIRKSPTGAAVSLEIPLLEGESVTSANPQVSQGVARVVLEPSDERVEWRSALDPTPSLRLTAPTEARWTESWLLDVAPVWHVEVEGIPPAGAPNGHGDVLHAFRPWPGELVSLEVGRPEPADGKILTIDSSSLTLKPGLRVTDAELSLVLRTSEGGRHPITPPTGAVLDSLRIDGTEHPVRREKDGSVMVPIRPGSQRVALSWQEDRPISWRFSPPEVDLGAPSVNASVKILPGGGRWILWTRGPMAGPAVHFWALLLTVLAAAFVLSRLRFSPLRFHEWALLGVGLTQVPLIASALVAGWLIALGYRKERTDLHPAVFNLRQLVLFGWALVALGILAAAIAEGLLGSPEMQIAGNGSTASTLSWYADRVDGVLPTPTMLSLPMFAYRIAMLAWALWLAFALLRWLRWGWKAFREGGGWRKMPINIEEKSSTDPKAA